MPHVFVSACRIDEAHAAALIERLRAESFSVSHSPRNPSDGEDVRWRNWYESGCRVELERADVFISVIGPAWDCSTWMAHECEEALRLEEAGRIRGMYFWNPWRVEVKAAGMMAYLRERLPDNLGELIRSLKETVEARADSPKEDL